MKKVIFVLVLVLAMLVVTACSPNSTPTTTTVAEVTSSGSEQSSASGDEEKPKLTVMEDFELTRLDGTKVKISEIAKRHTIINFWTTWCGFCNMELPHLIELAKRDDVAVIFLNQGETKEIVENHLKEKGYDIDVYLDEKRVFGGMFGVNGYPFNVFMTEGRELMTEHPGYLDLEQFEEFLKAIDEFREKNNL